MFTHTYIYIYRYIYIYICTRAHLCSYTYPCIMVFQNMISDFLLKRHQLNPKPIKMWCIHVYPMILANPKLPLLCHFARAASSKAVGKAAAIPDSPSAPLQGKPRESLQKHRNCGEELVVQLETCCSKQEISRRITRNIIGNRNTHARVSA